MSYIAFDLDALNKAPAVGRAAGVSEDQIIAGLIRLWAWCFREKRGDVTPGQIRGHFGSEVAPALVEFGFLETLGNTEFRVKGADRYLRIQEARKKGGQAAFKNGNLKRGKAPPVVLQPPLSPAGRSAGDSAGEQLESSWNEPPGSLQALHRTPNTEHRTPVETTTLSTKVDGVLAIAVFKHWQKAMGKEKSAFGDKRKRAVKARLAEGYTPQELCTAIDGCAVTPHNMGINDRGERFDDLELICRDASHVDRFIRNAAEPPKPSQPNGRGPVEYNAKYWDSKPEGITEVKL